MHVKKGPFTLPLLAHNYLPSSPSYTVVKEGDASQKQWIMQIMISVLLTKKAMDKEEQIDSTNNNNIRESKDTKTKWGKNSQSQCSNHVDIIIM